MGRHTKPFEPFDDDRAGDPGDRPEGSAGPADPAFHEPPAPGERSFVSHFGFVFRLPLLPLISSLIAVGIVAAAYGTKQISLNFAGGAPAQAQSSGQCGDGSAAGACTAGRTAQPKALHVPVTVAFTTTAQTAEGFKGTITLRNSGTKAVRSWTLVFGLGGARVETLTGGVVVKKGALVTVRGRAALRPGGVTRLLYVAKGGSTGPSSCVINKAVCVIPQS